MSDKIWSLKPVLNRFQNQLPLVADICKKWCCGLVAFFLKKSKFCEKTCFIEFFAHFCVSPMRRNTKILFFPYCFQTKKVKNIDFKTFQKMILRVTARFSSIYIWNTESAYLQKTKSKDIPKRRRAQFSWFYSKKHIFEPNWSTLSSGKWN